MEHREIFLDTSVILDYFRKTDKRNSFYFQLAKSYNVFSTSVICKYEVLRGSNPDQDLFWLNYFENIRLYPIDETVINIASSTTRLLKKQRQSLDIRDLLIGSTAQSLHLPVATINLKHFSRIEKLDIVAP